MENEINNTNETTNTIATLETRIENIENDVGIVADSNLFLIAFIVVLVVCFLLYKAIDNFISF